MKTLNNTEITGKRAPVENLAPGCRICEEINCEAECLYLSEGSILGIEEIQALKIASVPYVWVHARETPDTHPQDQPQGMKPRILIVDDMRLIRQHLADILVSGGYNIIGHADDGDTAVEMAELLHPDLVIMDIIMNRMSGIVATGLIKKANPGTKVVIITQTARPSIVAESFKAGADNFITKPLDNIHVLQVVRKVFAD